jgi:hypothetical protein
MEVSQDNKWTYITLLISIQVLEPPKFSLQAYQMAGELFLLIVIRTRFFCTFVSRII